VARRVFFSFHYERDVWRASQVRNSWVTQDRQSAGFWDAAKWEEAKRKGVAATQAWIDNELQGTSVTVVLVGAETSTRKYVEYEIEQSFRRGNGVLAVRIHGLKDSLGKTDSPGENPLLYRNIACNGIRFVITNRYPIYDWVLDSGYVNLGTWIEEAARMAGK
jgi:hypothetical protein